MHYLVSLAPEKDNEQADGELLAGNGEPVVPWFPAPVRNMFLSIASWRFTPYAIVVSQELNLDELVNQLAAKYPGLPRTLHENYVLETAVAAAQLPVGTRVRPIITTDEAAIQVVNEDRVITLWTEQPTKKRP